MIYSPVRSVAARVVVLLSSAASASLACTCISQGVKNDLATASVVFQGVVTDVEALPGRSGLGRARYVVTFSVSEYWKGNSGAEVKLHILEPGTDCIGARFEDGKEYVVFAEAREAKDYWLDERFWYGWLDVLQKGTRILTVNNYCDSTAEVKNAGKTLGVLGKGRKTHK